MILSRVFQGRLLTAGLASGFAQILAGVMMYVAGVYFHPSSMLVSVAVLGLSVVVAMQWSLRRPPDERASYGRAFRTGAMIAILTGLSYAVYNLITIGFVYPDFLDRMAQAQVDLLMRRGTSSADLQNLFVSVRGGLSAFRVAATNFAVLSTLGIVVACCAAVWVRGRPSEDYE